MSSDDNLEPEEPVRAQHVSVNEKRGIASVLRSFGPAHCGADGAIRDLSPEALEVGKVVSESTRRRNAMRHDCDE